MASVEVKEINYKNFGKCVQISNGISDIVVIVEAGPRIIRFGFNNEENELCDEMPVTIPIGDENFIFRGGHRLWHSPESMPRTYMPDNKAVIWSKIENGVILSQEIEPWVQVKKEIEITLEADSNKVKVLHRIINKNAWTVELSAWGVSMMAPGGKEVISHPNKETGVLPNRILALWPYSKMDDKRVYWGEKYIIINQDINNKESFKLGINNEAGWAAYFNHKNLFIKRYEHIDGAVYPDYGVSYETYTDQYLLELETLSPLTKIEPEQEIVHVEYWELIKNVELLDNNEENIDRIVKKYIVQ